MSTLQFVADVNKTVTVSGESYSITPTNIPENVTITLNEVVLQEGIPVTLSEDSTLGITVDDTQGYITVLYEDLESCTYDGDHVDTNERLEITSGEHTLNMKGGIEIPQVTLNGEGLVSLNVNASTVSVADLPYTFTPTAGITNSVYIVGSETASKQFTINGTNIATATINGTPVTLPYTGTITETTTIAVAGEIYQVDMTSKGGTVITKDGVIINDGSSTMHQIIDIDKDTYLTVDGTHTLTVTGEYINAISINGVTYPVSALPIEIKNNKTSVTVNISGYQPSEVHISGTYIDTATLDGAEVPIGENGSVDIEFETDNDNHFMTIIGSQPRKYGITWNDNGTTTLYMDGAEQTSGTTSYIEKDVYIEALHDPIPVHIESAPDVITEVNGRDYDSNDFTVNISQATEIDITTATCDLTIDYGDNSFNITVPQSVVTVTAPHRDGWIFDSWSSSDIGIESPKNVRTLLNLQGHNRGHLVCHYQRYCTINKPNSWN